MKKAQVICAGVVAVLGLLFILHAQETTPADSMVCLTAEAEGLERVASADLPRNGTFWEVMRGGSMAPLPCPPQDTSWPVYQIVDGIFLVDGTGGQVVLNAAHSTVASALEAQANAVVNLISRIQEAQLDREFALAFGLDVPTPGDGGDYGGGDYANLYSSSFYIDTNLLWLEITGTTNSATTNATAFLLIHPPWDVTNAVYDLFGTTNLVTPHGWHWVMRCAPGQTNLTVTNLTSAQEFFILGLTNDADDDGMTSAFEGLVSGTDPANGDQNTNGIPDGWEWHYFGNLDQTAAGDYDGDGVDNYDEYDSGYDPNKIQFSLCATSDHVNTSISGSTVKILGGVPSSFAILINSTDFANADWQPYTGTNVTLTLGATNGDYNVWVGLRGLPEDAQQTWHGTTITRDTLPPIIGINQPTAGTVSVPVIQLRGWASETLAGLTYSVSNAAGVISNQSGFVTGQHAETNSWNLTTNYFQCYDVALTNGANAITLHAVDLAGNVTTTNLTFTLDLAGDTAPPVLTVIWPQTNTYVAGSTFTLKGTLDDDTASVTVNIGSQEFAGMVERGGNFSVNLPMPQATNGFTLTAINAANNSTTNSWTVRQSAIQLTMDPPDADYLWRDIIPLSGTISGTNQLVWVNGIAATVSNEVWSAMVPAPMKGTLELLVQAGTGLNNLTSEEWQTVALPSRVWLTGYVDDYTSADAYTDGIETDYTFGQEHFNWDAGTGGHHHTHRLSYLRYEGDSGIYFPNENTVDANWPASGPEPTVSWQYCNEFASDTEQSYGTTDQFTVNRRVRSALSLVAGGLAQSGEWRVVRLTVSAAGYSTPLTSYSFYPFDFFGTTDGDVPVPLSDITINGQTPTPTTDDPDVGEVFVTVPAGSIWNIPYSVSGNPFYSIPVEAEDVPLQIIDANTGNDLTGRTNTVIVGQQMNWYCKLSLTNQFMTNFPLANFQWSVPGYAISNYVVAADTNSAMVFTNFPTVKSNVVFYWVDGASNRTVTCSATVDGKPVTGQATFNVLRPTADLIAFTNGSVAIDENGDSSGVNLYWGRAPLLFNLTNYGIRFYATNIMLNGCPSSSTFLFAQLATIQAEHNYTNGTSSRYTGSGLDTFYPAGHFFASEQFYHLEDEPSEPADGSAQVWRADDFSMYLLFQPDSSNSIPVPLKQLDWSWSGLAQTNGAGGWRLLSASTALQNINVSADYPTWTNNAIHGTTVTSNQWLNPFP